MKTKENTNINHTIDLIFLHANEKKFVHNCYVENPLGSTDHSCVCMYYKMPFDSLTHKTFEHKTQKHEGNVKRDMGLSDSNKEAFNKELLSIYK